MSLDHDERNALAGIRDGLVHADPQLARSLGGLGRPPRWRWWAGTGVVLAVGTAVVWTLGPLGIGILALFLVLGAPLTLLGPFSGSDGPPDRVV